VFSIKSEDNRDGFCAIFYITLCVFNFSELFAHDNDNTCQGLVAEWGVLRQHPHRRQELATLPSVGANP